MRTNLVEHVGFDAIVDQQYFAEHGFAFLEACQKLSSVIDDRRTMRRVIDYVGCAIFGQPGRMPPLWDRRGENIVPLILGVIYRHLRFKESLSLTEEQLRAWCRGISGRC
jgi:hypothetical protein